MTPPTEDEALDAWLYELLHRGQRGDKAFYRRECEGAAHVLEAGVGWGRLLDPLTRAARRVTGIDQHPGLLARAADRLSALPKTRAAKVRLTPADLLSPPEGAPPYDRVLLPFNTLFCLPDEAAQRAALTALRRVAAPDARLVLDVYVIDDAPPEPDDTDFEYLIIRAFAQVRHPDAVLEIAGAGDYRPALEQLVASLDLGARVRFLGFVSEEEKLALLRRAWAVALASPKEGWGLTNVEAEACGTPVVASNSPGIRESVRHGETGFLVPHGDVAALGAALDRVAQDPALVARMGVAARTFAESFTWERCARETEAHLRAVVARPAGLR